MFRHATSYVIHSHAIFQVTHGAGLLFSEGCRQCCDLVYAFPGCARKEPCYMVKLHVLTQPRSQHMYLRYTEY